MDIPEWQLSNLKEKNHLILCGMGGSGAAGGFLRQIVDFFNNARYHPFFISQSKEYRLPFLNESKTIVFLSSYSGNTEETLACAEEVRHKNLPCVVFSSGGRLLELAAEADWPYLKLPEGRPPRSCLGWSLVLQLRAAVCLGILSSELPDLIKKSSLKLKAQQHAIDTDSNDLSYQLTESFIVIVTDEVLYPVAERWFQQFCENAKSFSHIALVPEMNHNELVGWKRLPVNTHVLFLEHEGLNQRVSLRYKFLREYLENKKIKYTRILSPYSDLLSTNFYLIHFGDLLSDHLAMRNKEDSLEINVINELKCYLDEHRV